MKDKRAETDIDMSVLGAWIQWRECYLRDYDESRQEWMNEDDDDDRAGMLLSCIQCESHTYYHNSAGACYFETIAWCGYIHMHQTCHSLHGGVVVVASSVATVVVVSKEYFNNH